MHYYTIYKKIKGGWVEQGTEDSIIDAHRVAQQLEKQGFEAQVTSCTKRKN